MEFYYPGYSRISPSSLRILSLSPTALLPFPPDAYLYGRWKKRSLWRIIPSDQMSDFESICASIPVWGEGSDSGEAYSNVPVFPDRVREFNMSWDVPKSESIARGINLPSSHVNKTFPGLRSRCNMVFSCFWDSQHSNPFRRWHSYQESKS